MGKRDRKKYIGHNSKKSSYLAQYQTSSRGVLISHDRNKENGCKSDAFKMLNYFADLWYGKEDHLKDESDEEFNEDEEDCLDIAKQLAKEKEKRDKTKKKSDERRFSMQKHSSNNMVFIQFKGLPVPPSEFVQKIFDAVIEESKKVEFPKYIKHLLRMHPVDFGCRAEIEKIKEAAAMFIPTALDKLDTEVKEYNVSYKCRNNSNLGMHITTDAVNEAVKESTSNWKYNCRSNDVMIVVEIIGPVCTYSIVQRYAKLKKFNLRELMFATKSKKESISQKRKAEVNIGSENGNSPVKVLKTENPSTEACSVNAQLSKTETDSENDISTHKEDLSIQNLQKSCETTA